MRPKLTITSVAVFLLCCARLAQGQATSTNSISLQAKLDGVSGPTANLTVKFYDALTGGTQVGATITLNGVAVQNGIVSVPVSPVDATIFNGQTRYMGIGVNGGAELSPRTLVTSVPYALRSITAGDPIGDLTIQHDLTVQRRIVSNMGTDPSGVIYPAFMAYGVGDYVTWGGVPANFYSVCGAAGEINGGFGMVYGNGIASPIIYYNGFSGRGSFQVRGVNAPGASPVGPNSGVSLEVFPDRTMFFTTVSVPVLQIRGADVAEPFDVTALADTTKPAPGMVVSIDPANPGKLRVSTTPYDKKVAGAISGANGLSVGVVMGKDNADPLIQAEHPVAMAGRVYVWCDASAGGGGAIEPGDMLTTSATPGHAMKAVDQTKAFGAVIGKAMTELKEGKGLVLVLVNLQ